MTTDERGGRTVASLQIDPAFFDFVENELLPAIRFDSDRFWKGLAGIIDELSPVNRKLLQKRDLLQQRIDDWHGSADNTPLDHAEYVAFLKSIGYLVEPGEPFSIGTENVDPEIATIAGPQLVVPVSNPRFALNAANARWGSLYDALYGTDVIDESDGKERSGGYNATRGAAVIRYAQEFLDKAIPLDGASHGDVSEYVVADKVFAAIVDDAAIGLQDTDAFRGWSEAGDAKSLLFQHNGLHIEIKVDPTHPVGKDAGAHVADVILESAITTIQDCEDSVAAVDAEDKVNVYRNWLGLMQGTLETTFAKGGKDQTRRLNADRRYKTAAGDELVLSGRSLMLVRNVGHLMTNDAVLDKDGNETYEGMLDAVITSACAMANRLQSEREPNSRHGSIYIVKPKMHGPDEARFTDVLFSRVEELFELEANTLKVGVMDEERRTTVNLEECIRAVRDRLVFINTGFLDRTGDEIHTSMYAGPDEAERGYQAGAVDPRLRGLERRCRYPLWASGQSADRQGDVAEAGRDEADDGHQAGSSGGGRELCLGAVADSRDASRDALSPRRCCGAAAGTCVAPDSEHRRHFDAAPGRSVDSWRRGRFRANWTTMHRGSSVTSSAGSTRASAVRRCPTSAMSGSWKTARRSGFPVSTLPTGLHTAWRAKSRCAKPFCAWRQLLTNRMPAIPPTSA